MVRLWPLVFLVGCSTNKCHDLLIDQLVYQESLVLEDSVTAQLRGIVQPSWSLAQLDSVERIVRYNLVAAQKRKHGLTPVPGDSLFHPELPPSPENQRWYAEHCYGGREV